MCELTWLLVYSKLKPSGTGISRLTFDQRQTLYAFVSYVLSSAAQDRLVKANFQSLPASVVSTLRSGFQSNY